MESRIEIERMKTCKKAVIKMGEYNFPVKSFLFETLLRTGKKGLSKREIYEEMKRNNVNEKTAESCLYVLVKDKDVEIFWMSKSLEKTKYRIKR